ncbi:MAG: sigma-70 family RNA polymerase sigma factor [Thermoleophilia bacterium]
MTDSDDPRHRFEELWDAQHAAVLAYALRRTDPDTARDVVAEAFTAAWRRIDDVPEHARLWMLGLARGALSNIRRADRRRAALTEQIATTVARDGSVESLGLADAIRDLSDRDAEALLLVAWDGLSHAEAARVVGCTTATFTVRVHRARRRLAALLGRPTTTPVVPEGSE